MLIDRAKRAIEAAWKAAHANPAMVNVAVICTFAGFLLGAAVTGGSIPGSAAGGTPSTATQPISAGLFALLGALIGGGVSILTARMQGHQSARTQITASLMLKRAEIHQQGFALWSGFIDASYNHDDAIKLAEEARSWWIKNCVYLSENAREKFLQSCSAMVNYTDFLNIIRENDKSNIAHILERNHQLIIYTGQALIEGAGGSIASELLESLIRDRAEFLVRYQKSS